MLHSASEDPHQTVFSLSNFSIKPRDKQLWEPGEAASRRQVAAQLPPFACASRGFCSGHVSNSAGRSNGRPYSSRSFLLSKCGSLAKHHSEFTEVLSGITATGCWTLDQPAKKQSVGKHLHISKSGLLKKPFGQDSVHFHGPPSKTQCSSSLSSDPGDEDYSLLVLCWLRATYGILQLELQRQTQGDVDLPESKGSHGTFPLLLFINSWLSTCYASSAMATGRGCAIPLFRSGLCLLCFHSCIWSWLTACFGKAQGPWKHCTWKGFLVFLSTEGVLC